MDVERFAALVRSLPGLPRRAALGGLLGGELLALLAGIAPRVGAKKKKRSRREKKCKKRRKQANEGTCFTCGAGTKQCGTECIRSDACCGGCGELQCCDGVCAECCGSAETFCDGVCTDLSTDGAHCGACSNACSSAGCVHGACTCPEGITQCPPGCPCIARPTGEPACAAGVGSGPPCTADADCSLGSFCIQLGSGESICTDPCLA